MQTFRLQARGGLFLPFSSFLPGTAGRPAQDSKERLWNAPSVIASMCQKNNQLHSFFPSAIHLLVHIPSRFSESFQICGWKFRPLSLWTRREAVQQGVHISSSIEQFCMSEKKRREAGENTVLNVHHMAASQKSPSLPSAGINSEDQSCG